MTRHLRSSILATVVSLLAVLALLTAGSSQAGGKSTIAKGSYEILFVRHAHSTYPPPEAELSARGIEEAAALAVRLQSTKITSVDTSMMLRAYQTGDNLALPRNLPIVADNRIREVAFGVDSATHLQEIIDITTAWYHGQRRGERLAEGGETYDEVAKRWGSWWKQYSAEHRFDRGRGVVVSHGALMGLMLQRTCANKLTPEFVMANPVANTSYVKATLTRDGKLTCTEWNGVKVPTRR